MYIYIIDSGVDYCMLHLEWNGGIVYRSDK
jgi:hypothetical protein